MGLDMITEELTFFPCREESLAGVLTIPSDPNGLNVLLAWGAGTFPSAGRNRIRTRLARKLAARGYHVFRFDYMGVGESSGEYSVPRMSTPYVDEIVAAAEWLASRGLDRLIIVGNCFGAWSALMAAPSIHGLKALALSGSPVRRDHKQAAAANTSWQWWIRKLTHFNPLKLRDSERRAIYRRIFGGKASALFRPRSRDTRFNDAIETLVERGIPILLIHAENSLGDDVRSELDSGLSEVLEQGAHPTRVLAVEDTVGSSFDTQAKLIRAVEDWLDDIHSAVTNRKPMP